MLVQRLVPEPDPGERARHSSSISDRGHIVFVVFVFAGPGALHVDWFCCSVPGVTVWTIVWSLPLISVSVSPRRRVVFTEEEEGGDSAIMASFKLDFLPEMMVDHCSLNSSPV